MQQFCSALKSLIEVCGLKGKQVKVLYSPAAVSPKRNSVNHCHCPCKDGKASEKGKSEDLQNQLTLTSLRGKDTSRYLLILIFLCCEAIAR